MFLVNKEDKTTQEIKDISFKSCGLKERDDLQEWISNNPMILGEELLIIQKEFDGFSDTNERLDLLAIDKNGNLVIIENKLDDSGKNVVWQAMKYAGYCSSLKNDDIKEIYQQYINKRGLKVNAEESITEFLEKADFSEVQLNQDLSQRIILVAREFRKEVTNTVIWARKFGIKIQCIKIIPYQIAGHMQAGDEPEESAIRELHEELGIRAAKEDLTFAGCFDIQYEKEFYGKMFRDNEVAFVYMYTKPVDAKKLILQKEEVESVEWFDMEELDTALQPPRDQRFCVPMEGFLIAKQWWESRR